MQKNFKLDFTIVLGQFLVEQLHAVHCLDVLAVLLVVILELINLKNNFKIILNLRVNDINRRNVIVIWSNA